MRVPSTLRLPAPIRRLPVAAAAAALAASTLAVAAAPSEANPGRGVDVAVEWWDVAGTTLRPPAAPAGVENFRAWAVTWFGAARAVNVRPTAGPALHFRTAAFAAAVHESLATLVPTRRAELDAALATTLDRVPDGSAETAGVAAGRDAARGVLAQRQGDGLDNASVTRPYTPPPAAPGVWRPTPDRFLPGQNAGLADARPFGMDSPDQFRPGPPPRLGTARYRADLAEVRAWGAVDSTVRTKEQTDLATFMHFSTPNFFHPAVRAGLLELSGDLRRQAEFMAVIRMAFVDAGIAVWDAKYHYVSWRPVTAIREADTDGDPATAPDPTWTPLHETPAHPDYLSGHTGLNGAVVQTLKAYTGAGPDAPVTFTDPNVPGIALTYDNWDELDRDMIDARVYSGIHTRSADAVGSAVGARVARHLLRNTDRLFR